MNWKGKKEAIHQDEVPFLPIYKFHLNYPNSVLILLSATTFSQKFNEKNRHSEDQIIAFFCLGPQTTKTAKL